MYISVVLKLYCYLRSFTKAANQLRFIRLVWRAVQQAIVRRQFLKRGLIKLVIVSHLRVGGFDTLHIGKNCWIVSISHCESSHLLVVVGVGTYSALARDLDGAHRFCALQE